MARLLGWLYATAVFVAGNALYDRLRQRRAINAAIRDQAIEV
jgi:hypothetical protein